MRSAMAASASAPPATSARRHASRSSTSSPCCNRPTGSRMGSPGVSFHRRPCSSSSSASATKAAAARRPAAFRVDAATADPATSSSSSSAHADPAAPAPASPPLRYEMVQGPLVKWSVESPDGPHPPTAVLIHGILGSRRNLLSFAKRLSQTFPSWQFLLVDLRCHGQTANMEQPPEGPNNVVSAAKDVLRVLNHLKIYPHTLLGHSFGGKVAMSMVHQFGKQLPRPVQVWVLDTVPGDVWCEAGDHPRDTINFARTIPMPIATRRDLVDCLTGAGFTLEWMTTNLTPLPGGSKGELTWTFDLEGIVEMYKSYEATDLWPMLETQPRGLKVDFVRAERSAFVWTPEDIARIGSHGGRVHYLPNASHWVHIDNPDGLLEILAPSFGVYGAEKTMNK